MNRKWVDKLQSSLLPFKRFLLLCLLFYIKKRKHDCKNQKLNTGNYFACNPWIMERTWNNIQLRKLRLTVAFRNFEVLSWNFQPTFSILTEPERITDFLNAFRIANSILSDILIRHIFIRKCWFQNFELKMCSLIRWKSELSIDSCLKFWNSILVFHSCPINFEH